MTGPLLTILLPEPDAGCSWSGGPTPARGAHFHFNRTQAAKKWRTRRAAEVRTNVRRIPLSADSLLSDYLREAGAPVYMAGGRKLSFCIIPNPSIASTSPHPYSIG